jgi:hypothetical protein
MRGDYEKAVDYLKQQSIMKLKDNGDQEFYPLTVDNEELGKFGVGT